MRVSSQVATLKYLGKNRARMGYLAPLLILAAIAFSGCSYTAGGADVSLSPDGAWAAYSWAKQWDLPLPPEMPTVRSEVWLRWCKLSCSKEARAAKMGVFGKDWSGYDVKNRIHPIFSPDNRYLAVASPRRLCVIDCLTGEQHTLTGPDEVATSLVWLDKTQLAYASCSMTTDRQRKGATKRFWRQKIDGSPGERDLIFIQDESYGCAEKGLDITAWPRERWSPDGRFALFKAQGFRGGLMLLDVAAGKATVIAPTGYTFEGLSWKSDGSRAACLGLGQGGIVLAFIINPRTGEKQDFSEHFSREFRDEVNLSAASLYPLWTPDDQYLVINDVRKGGCLLQPHLWKVIPVAKLLIDHLKQSDSRVLAKETESRLPWAFWQPAKGWVRVWVQFQERGYRRGIDYLVDYSGRAFVPLGESGAPGGGWKITPDGKHAVKVEGPGELEVRELRLPSGGKYPSPSR